MLSYRENHDRYFENKRNAGFSIVSSPQERQKSHLSLILLQGGMIVKAFAEFGHETPHTKSSSHTEFKT